MSLRPVTHVAGTPYPEVTGLICRVPSQTLCPTRLGLLSQGHLCQFLVRTQTMALYDFSRAPANRQNPPEGESFGVCIGSHHDDSPRCYGLRHGDSRAPARRMRYRIDRVVRGAGILTCFPFARIPLRSGLGPTNPRLTIIAEETWPFRRCGFSPHYAVTHTRILVETRSSGP